MDRPARFALWLFVALGWAFLFLYIVGRVGVARGDEPAAPGLIVTTGTAGVTIASDSPRAWKRYVVQPTATAGQYSIILAEHGQGDDGGIWTYTVQITSTAAVVPAPVNPPTPVNPPAPGPGDLPLAELAAIKPAGLPADEARLLATAYDGLADQADGGAAKAAPTITSPTQLALATSTQYLSILAAGRYGAWKPYFAQIGTWFTTQQQAGRLGNATMPAYAAAYRALAKALRAYQPAVTGKVGDKETGRRGATAALTVSAEVGKKRPAGIPANNNGCELECGDGVCTVTCPVSKSCPRSEGASVLYVKDGAGKSVSPCGCVTRLWCPCLPDGQYRGECKDAVCTYRIAGGCHE
jgi:hypothetical protein